MNKETNNTQKIVVEDLQTVEARITIPSDYIKTVENFLTHSETQEEITKLSSYVFPTPLEGAIAVPPTSHYVKATATHIKKLSEYFECHITEVNKVIPETVLVNYRATMHSKPKRKGFTHTIYVKVNVLSEASAVLKERREFATDISKIHPAEREFMKYKKERGGHGLSPERQRAMFKEAQDMGAYRKDQWSIIEGMCLEICSKHKTYAGAIASGNIVNYTMGKGDKERYVMMAYTPWLIDTILSPMRRLGYIDFNTAMEVSLPKLASVKKRKLTETQMNNAMKFRSMYFFLEKEIHEFSEAEWSRIVAMPSQFVPMDGTPLAIREEWRYKHVINQLVDKHTARIAARMQMREGYAHLLAGTAATYLATRSVTAKERGLKVQPILSDKDLHNEIRTLFQSYGDSAKALDKMEMKAAKAAGEAIASSETNYADYSSSDYVPNKGQRNYKISEQDIAMSYIEFANKYFIDYLEYRAERERAVTHNADGSLKTNVSLMDYLDFIGECEDYELERFGKEIHNLPVGSIIALYYRNLQRDNMQPKRYYDRTKGASVRKSVRIADLKAPVGWYEASMYDAATSKRARRFVESNYDAMSVAERIFERGGRWGYNTTIFDMQVLGYLERLHEGEVLHKVHPQSVNGVVRIKRERQ